MDGILSDTAILEAIRYGDILINPFREDQINPSSYDVTLGDEVAVYESVTGFRGLPLTRECDGSDLIPFVGEELIIKRPLDVRRFKIDPAVGWVLKPGIGYLMHTAEHIWTGRFVPVLDGKSTIGRLFVSIHETAGYGDPGFNGQFTLEVTCTHPVRLYPGMRIGQVRFHTIVGEVRNPYNRTGHYKDSDASGPVASQAYRLFESKR